MADPAIQTGEAADTAERILDAAELLFIEHGYQGASMRAIASRADVNLAAANYHFGSKKGLLAAVMHRRIEPINHKRLMLLEELTGSERQPTTRDILKVFFRPVADSIAMGLPVAQLLGRLYGEPESLVRPILEKEFTVVAESFQRALSRSMPQVSIDDLRFRFHLMIGSMIHLLKMPAPLGTEYDPDSFNQDIEHLIDFVEAGLLQSNTRQGP